MNAVLATAAPTAAAAATNRNSNNEKNADACACNSKSKQFGCYGLCVLPLPLAHIIAFDRSIDIRQLHI